MVLSAHFETIIQQEVLKQKKLVSPFDLSNTELVYVVSGMSVSWIDARLPGSQHEARHDNLTVANAARKVRLMRRRQIRNKLQFLIDRFTLSTQHYELTKTKQENRE